jgi:hypothetical protein
MESEWKGNELRKNWRREKKRKLKNKEKGEKKKENVNITIKTTQKKEEIGDCVCDHDHLLHLHVNKRSLLYFMMLYQVFKVLDIISDIVDEYN